VGYWIHEMNRKTKSSYMKNAVSRLINR